MQNISQLRDAGFTLHCSVASAGCTELLRAEPFWHFNPEFGTPNVRNLGEVKAATLHGGRYSLVVSGDYLDATEFPVAIITAQQMDALQAARAKYFFHRNEAEKAEDDFDGVLTVEAACEAGL